MSEENEQNDHPVADESAETTQSKSISQDEQPGLEVNPVETASVSSSDTVLHGDDKPPRSANPPKEKTGRIPLVNIFLMLCLATLAVCAGLILFFLLSSATRGILNNLFDRIGIDYPRAYFQIGPHLNGGNRSSKVGRSFGSNDGVTDRS